MATTLSGTHVASGPGMGMFVVLVASLAGVPVLAVAILWLTWPLLRSAEHRRRVAWLLLAIGAMSVLLVNGATTIGVINAGCAYGSLEVENSRLRRECGPRSDASPADRVK